MKESIQQIIGDEPLYSDRMKREIVRTIQKKKYRNKMQQRLNLALPAFVLVFLVGGWGVFYGLLSGDEPVHQPGVELETIAPSEQEQLQETFNLTMRIIDAMVTKDYAYLESVSDSSVTIDYENEILTYDDWGYQAFIDSFEYENFEYRGFMVEGDSLFLILGVYNVSYEFQFVRDPDSEEGYLLKSLLTN